MRFILEYLKHPRRIGAVAPSGHCLSKKMMKPIDFSSANVIVEYGSGTGSFTREIVRNRKEETMLLLIEQNEHFCQQLEQKYGEAKNIHIIKGNAENVGDYLKQYGFSHADYIVSGLPFISLPKSVSERILHATSEVLGVDGSFITFQYSLVKKHFFEQYFSITDCLHELCNLPPAYVLVMKKQEKS